MLAVCTIAGCILLPSVTEFTRDTAYVGGSMRNLEFQHNITLFSGSTVTGFEFKGPGQLIVAGSDVLVKDVVTELPILVIADNPSNLNFTNVSCPQCEAAVTVLGGAGAKHGAVELGTMVLNEVVAKPGGFAAAIAHAAGLVDCAHSTPRILVQPIRARDISVNKNCGEVLDLSVILNVYGQSYMLTFFDGPGHSVGHVVYIIKVLVAVLLVELTVLYLAAYHVVHEIHLARHRRKKAF